MSIFSFFSRKATTKVSATPDSSGLAMTDATQPLTPAEQPHHRRKSERHGQRELLYNVVRDTMTRAGVLAACYKFKVLSLDTRGMKYLIMMDLVHGAGNEVQRLTEIEAVLAQTAKVRHDLLVTAVYWRISEQVTAGLSAAPTQRSAALANRPATPSATAATLPGFEPLQQDEIAAFKRAVASATAPAQTATSGSRQAMPKDEFEDTQISPATGRQSPLSVTQYGDLN